jgi:hypothetical protein
MARYIVRECKYIGLIMRTGEHFTTIDTKGNNKGTYSTQDAAVFKIENLTPKVENIPKGKYIR